MPRAEAVRQLGMNNVWRIASWQDQVAAARAKETGVALVRIDTPIALSSSGVVLVTPSGYRIEGLAMEQVAALLRELA
jgi:hypothetical protein